MCGSGNFPLCVAPQSQLALGHSACVQWVKDWWRPGCSWQLAPPSEHNNRALPASRSMLQHWQQGQAHASALMHVLPSLLSTACLTLA